jgi:hypothetical protein
VNVFAKIFQQIFDSSIADDYLVRHVFMDLLVLADRDGVVDMTLEAISRRTNVPLEIVTAAVAQLASPDNRSRSDLEAGARIVLLDSHREWGWQIVNYEHYRNIRDEESRKAYFRDYKRSYRSKKSPEVPQVSNPRPTRSTPVHTVSTSVLDSPTMSTKGEGELDTEVQVQKPSPKPRKRVPEGPKEIKHSTDPRHVACKAEIFFYYRGKNDADPPWDGREGKALAMFLSSSPKLTAEGVKRILLHRADSEVNHGDRPSMWIHQLMSFVKGPVDRYGKPMGADKPNGTGFLSAQERRAQKAAEFMAKED